MIGSREGSGPPTLLHEAAIAVAGSRCRVFLVLALVACSILGVVSTAQATGPAPRRVRAIGAIASCSKKLTTNPTQGSVGTAVYVFFSGSCFPAGTQATLTFTDRRGQSTAMGTARVFCFPCLPIQVDHAHWNVIIPTAAVGRGRFTASDPGHGTVSTRFDVAP